MFHVKHNRRRVTQQIWCVTLILCEKLCVRVYLLNVMCYNKGKRSEG